MPILTSEKRAEIITDDEFEKLVDTLEIIRKSPWLSGFIIDTLVGRELIEIKAGKHMNPKDVAIWLARDAEELEIQLDVARGMIEQFPVEAGVKEPSQKPPKPATKKGPGD